MTANEIREQLVASGIAAVGEIHGYTAREVEALERRIGRALPLAYRQFLLAVGHGAGFLLHGTDVFLDRVDALNDSARELLVGNGFAGQLPEDAFVFYMHQGYEFGYFRINEGEDPAVYQYWEGSHRPPQLAWPSFTDYLIAVIRNHEEALPAMKQLRASRKQDAADPPAPNV